MASIKYVRAREWLILRMESTNSLYEMRTYTWGMEGFKNSEYAAEVLDGGPLITCCLTRSAAATMRTTARACNHHPDRAIVLVCGGGDFSSNITVEAVTLPEH